MNTVSVGKDVNIFKAILFSIGAALALSIMAVFVKLAAPYTNNNMTILFRFGVSFFYIMIVLRINASRGKNILFRTPHLTLHFFRAFTAVMSMLCFYYSLKFIPLVNGNLLVMTNTLFIPVLTWVFFRTRTSLKVYAGVLLGFIGVGLILKPTSELFRVASLIAVFGGLNAAISLLLLRELGKKENLHVTMFYYFTLSFLISIIISIFHWQTPNMATLILLLMVGVFGTLYQDLLIRASTCASALLISALMYTSIIFSTILGNIVWHETPDFIEFCGIFVVVAGSIIVTKLSVPKPVLVKSNAKV